MSGTWFVVDERDRLLATCHSHAAASDECRRLGRLYPNARMRIRLAEVMLANDQEALARVKALIEGDSDGS